MSVLTSKLWMAHAQANMMLRSEQKTQLLDLRRTLLQTMATLLQERRMIQALIKASLLWLLPLALCPGCCIAPDGYSAYLQWPTAELACSHSRSG